MAEYAFEFGLLAAFLAGLVRGFSGFGGPALLLLALSWFYTPMLAIGKILIIEFISAGFLFWKVRGEIQWKPTAAITIPTVLSMPLGYQLLTHTDADLMRQLIAAVTLLCSLLMLVKWRYSNPLSLPAAIAVGFVGGIVFGASYIALPIVAVVLLGPQNRAETRNLLFAWGFITAVAYLLQSTISGHTQGHDVIDAIPYGICYFIGCWAGASLFHLSTESSYRKSALVLLITLSAIGLLKSS